MERRPGQRDRAGCAVGRGHGCRRCRLSRPDAAHRHRRIWGSPCGARRCASASRAAPAGLAGPRCTGRARAATHSSVGRRRGAHPALPDARLRRRRPGRRDRRCSKRAAGCARQAIRGHGPEPECWCPVCRRRAGRGQWRVRHPAGRSRAGTDRRAGRQGAGADQGAGRGNRPG